MLQNKKILLGITGGIAAYKIPELIRQLTEQGAYVRCCLSQSATQFVTPTTCQTLSSQAVYGDLFTDPTNADAMPHITLAKWADMLLIAPATADVIAKLAHGQADSLLSNIFLAYSGITLLAPAMNQQMWQNPATQNNISILKSRAVQILGPGTGIQACGDHGPGRMLEPEQLTQHLLQHCYEKILHGKNILITSGPTHEPIDPVRYISNHSSGKMGFSLAMSAHDLGANVTLITGPSALPIPNVNTVESVQSAHEMHSAVMRHIDTQDVFVSCAAVADYTPINYSNEKIKKTSESFTIECTKTPDILAAVGQLDNKPLTIGFAAETQHLIASATKKLHDKNCDAIIANQVGPGIGMRQDENAVTILHHSGSHALPLQGKLSLAYDIWQFLINKLNQDIHAEH